MGDKLFNRFREVVDSLSLEPGQQIIIALGGGADSQTLLDLTMRYRQHHPEFQYLAVHLDHRFHADSAQWSRTIERAAIDYAVKRCFEPIEVPIRGRQSKEAAGRERRYQRLRELSSNNAVILLGQHRNDQIETFLLQLNRGSGPKGLASMAEVHGWFEQRRLVRPLLTFSKQEIYDYAHQHRLTWIEDDTNYDTRIERNFLRHDVIPRLEQRWPQFGDSVLRSAKLCAEQQQVMDALLDEKLDQSTIKHQLIGNGLPVDTLRNKPEAMQRALLRRWLEIAGGESVTLPSYQQLEQIRQQSQDARADTKMCVQCAEYHVRFYQMALWVVQAKITTAQSVDPLPITSAGIVKLPEPWGKLLIEQKLVDAHQVELRRTLVAGKWQHPNRQGRKSLTDWLKQAQVPAWLRSSAPYLSLDNSILWLPSVGWLVASATNANEVLDNLPEPHWLRATD